MEGVYPGDFDRSISRDYHTRYLRALMTNGEEPHTVLRDFLVKYPLEFFHSDWVSEAAGALLLGLRAVRDSKSRQAAKRFLNWYWSYLLSPIREKEIRALSALVWYRSPHREHWLFVVRWTRNQPNPSRLTGFVAANRYIRSHRGMCECLSRDTVERLCSSALDYPKTELSDAEVVFQCLAKINKMSSKTLRQYGSGW